MNLRRRITAIFTCFCMLATMIPAGYASAEGESIGTNFYKVRTYNELNSISGQSKTCILVDDIDVNATINISNNAVLDLNGHTIAGKGNCPIFNVSSGKTLTIKNSGKTTIYSEGTDLSKADTAEYTKPEYTALAAPAAEAISTTFKGCNKDESVQYMFDGDSATKYCCYTNTDNPKTDSITVSFSYSEAKTVARYSFTSGGDTNSYAARIPKSWILYGSNDETTWNEIDSVSEPKMATESKAQYTYNITKDNIAPYKFYKVVFTVTKQDGYFFQLADMGLYGETSGGLVIGDKDGNVSRISASGMIVGPQTFTGEGNVVLEDNVYGLSSNKQLFKGTLKDKSGEDTVEFKAGLMTAENGVVRFLESDAEYETFATDPYYTNPDFTIADNLAGKRVALASMSGGHALITPVFNDSSNKILAGFTSGKSTDYYNYDYVLGDYLRCIEFVDNSKEGEGHYFLKMLVGEHAGDYLKFNKQNNLIEYSAEGVDTIAFTNGTYTPNDSFRNGTYYTFRQTDGEDHFFSLNNDGGNSKFDAWENDGKKGVNGNTQAAVFNDTNNWFKILEDNRAPENLSGKTGALINEGGYAVTNTANGNRLSNDKTTVVNKKFYATDSCDTDSLRCWTFTAVPKADGGTGDGTDGKYYIQDTSSGKYLRFNESGNKATLVDTKVVTYVSKVTAGTDLNGLNLVQDAVDTSYKLKQMVFDQNGGLGDGYHFGAWDTTSESWLRNSSCQMKFIYKEGTQLGNSPVNFWYSLKRSSTQTFNCLTIDMENGRSLESILKYLEVNDFDGTDMIPISDIRSVEGKDGIKAENTGSGWMIYPRTAIVADKATLTITMNDDTVHTIYATSDRVRTLNGKWTDSKNFGGTNFFDINSLFGSKQYSKFILVMNGDVDVESGTNSITKDAVLKLVPDERTSGDIALTFSKNNLIMFAEDCGNLEMHGSDKSKFIVQGKTDLSNYAIGGTGLPSDTVKQAEFLYMNNQYERNNTNISNCIFRNIYNENGGQSPIVDFVSGKLSMKKCTVVNAVSRYGGECDAPISMHGGKGVLNIKDCVFSNNAGDGQYYGGGVIKSCNGGDYNLTIDGSTFDSNKSCGWGGVMLWAAEKNSCKAVITNTVFNNNSAILGGALSNEAAMEISGCTFTNNTAKSGGAVASFPFTLSGSAFGLELGEGNVFHDNTATASSDFTAFGKSYRPGGGAIWICMNKSGFNYTFNLGKGNSIYNNYAYGNGGGVMMYKTDGNVVSLGIDGATITNNTASRNGGGIYVEKASLLINEGYIDRNTAVMNGGGVCSNNAVVNLTNKGSVSSNKAANGGGVYVENGGTMTISGGKLMYNHAAGLPESTVTTAYDSAKNVGVGGGVYLQKGKLAISSATAEIGIYKNSADFAADDIYASKTDNSNTLSFPSVAEMTIKDEKGHLLGEGLNWCEDYATRDTKYQSSATYNQCTHIDLTETNSYENGSDDIMRYDDAVANNLEDHKWVTSTTSYTNPYLCLTLGYQKGYELVAVSKEVSGKETSEKFTFDYSYRDSLTGETVKGSFELGDGEEHIIEKIPEFSTNMVISERGAGDYITSYQIDDNEPSSGKIVSIADVVTENVKFINSVSDYSISVSKTFKGLTQEQIDELDSNGYIIEVTNNSITPADVKKLSLSAKEGAIAYDKKTTSEDGITYTWNIPGWWEGQYDVEEINAEVSGCSLATKVNGKDAAETESGTMKIENIDISGEDSAGNTSDIESVTEVNPYEALKVVITDDIKNSGNLVASIEDGEIPAGYHIEWYSSINTVNWFRINKTTYTSGDTNISGPYSEKINVALTGGARTETAMTTYRAILTADNAVPSADAIPKAEFVQSKYYDRIMNGGFEDVQIPNGTNWCNPSPYLKLMVSSDRTDEQIEEVIKTRYSGYTLGYTRIEDSLIWKTTQTDGVIELSNASPEKSGREGNYQTCAMDAYFSTVAPVHSITNNVTYEGDQMVELNASEASSLYQDVLTVPGTKLYWSFMHRERKDSGENRMKVVIMSTMQAEELLASPEFANPQVAVEYVLNHSSEFPGAVVSDDLEATVSEWTNHSGSYEVPEGQALTRLFFISTNSSKPGIGNLIDDVSLSTDRLVPDNSEATLVINKTFKGSLSDDERKNLIQNLKVNYSYIDAEGQTVEGTIGTGEEKFKWSANDQGTITFTLDIPAGKDIEFKISEDLESAAVSGCSHHVQYSAVTTRGGHDTGMDSSGKYSITMKGGEVATVNILNEYTGRIDIENEYEMSSCDLTIIKNVVGDMDDEDQRFRFHVTGTPETATKDVDMYVAAMKVEGEKSYSVTICDLPAGKYTVTEDTDWSWRYESVDEDTKEITISPKEPDKNKVTFNNTLKNRYWLSGTSYAVNNKAGRIDELLGAQWR